MVAHQSPLVLDGIAAGLRARADVADVVVASTRDDCVHAAVTQHLDTAVVDIDLSPGGELVLCEVMRTQAVPTLIVTQGGAVDPLSLLEAGAQGVVFASDGLDELLIAVSALLNGQAYLPAHLLGTVLQELIVRQRAPDAAVSRVARLSPRERQVLGLLGSGADHREIAARLVISPHTAKTHIQRLLGKLEVRSRIEAAALAATYGVTAPDAEVTT